MRLDDNNINIIKTVLLNKMSDAKIFLFGSRVYDTKRGGDIDIFVKTSQDISLKDELSLLVQFEISGITRKVDLVIETPRKGKEQFFNSIKDEAIALC